VRRTDTSAWPCNIARSAAILGDHLLIRQACLGFRRYEDFQRTLGIGRNMLTIRLNGLVDHGILERVEYQAKPPRSEYRLTDMGRDAYTVLAAMDAWGRRWLAGPQGTPVLLHHQACDLDMHAVVVCSECSRPLDVRQVTARPAHNSSRAAVGTAAGPLAGGSAYRPEGCQPDAADPPATS
jgi:DNA-binding HxlR family transcriptional regulator